MSTLNNYDEGNTQTPAASRMDPANQVRVIDTDSLGASASHSTISRDDRSMKDVTNYLGDLFKRLTTDLSQLLSLHVDLLKAEMRDSLRVLVRDSAMIGVAGVMGWFAFAVLTLAIAAGIGGVLPIENQLLGLAAGAAIVGVVYAVIAGILAMVGVSSLRKKSLAPDRTLREVKRDKDAVKEMHS